MASRRPSSPPHLLLAVRPPSPPKRTLAAHFFDPGPIGLEFTARKRGAGVLIANVVPGSRAAAAGTLRRGMLLLRANGADARGVRVHQIGAMLTSVGFPLTLEFRPAPAAGVDAARHAMLIARIQRRFRARLARRRAAEAAAPPVPKRNGFFEQPASMPLPLPPRPTTSGPTLADPIFTNAPEVLVRCQNCGTISKFPTLRMRSLFRSCGLCHVEFSKITQAFNEGKSVTLPRDPDRSCDDPIPDFPRMKLAGPEHSLLGTKNLLTLNVLAASLGSDELAHKAVDVTDALHSLITTSDEGERLRRGEQDAPVLRNRLNLPVGFDCTENLLRWYEPPGGPRMDIVRSVNDCFLRARFELTELSGAPFRRWTTKQRVVVANPLSSPPLPPPQPPAAAAAAPAAPPRLVIDGPSIRLRPPLEPLIRVLPSSFLGHLVDPLLQYPVHEEIQAEIDLDMEEEREELKVGKAGVVAPELKDGSFLVIGPSHSQLVRAIGDPHPGAEKILRLDLDMQGFSGEIVVRCSSGHLHQPICIQGPVLAPTLVVRGATYGAEAPYDPAAKRRSDVPVFDPDRSCEVSVALQKWIDRKGGGQELDWTMVERDITVERLLGLKESPAPGAKKKLLILYDRRGIRGRVVVDVRRNGTLDPRKDSLHLTAPQLMDSRPSKYAVVSRAFGFSSPQIVIHSASYGTCHGSRFAQRIDVRAILQGRVDKSPMNDLRLSLDENLDDLFEATIASWAGAELRIVYEVRSFVTRIDVPVTKDPDDGKQRLGCEVRLGYLRRPITAPHAVDAGTAMRLLIGTSQKVPPSKGKGGGMVDDPLTKVDEQRPDRSKRWVGVFDQPKTKGMSVDFKYRQHK